MNACGGEGASCACAEIVTALIVAQLRSVAPELHASILEEAKRIIAEKRSKNATL